MPEVENLIRLSSEFRLPKFCISHWTCLNSVWQCRIQAKGSERSLCY